MLKTHSLSRRRLLKLAGMGSAALVAACQPKLVEVEKVVVETVVVTEEKIVKEAVEVEKEVTRVVEKVVEAKPASPEVVECEYWSYYPSEGGVQITLMSEFNELNRDRVHFTYVFAPKGAGTQVSEKLMVNVAAGTPPEAAWFDRFVVPAWAAEDALTDITDRMVTSEIKEEDYYPFCWAEASWKDKQYALPFDTDARALSVNAAHLREVGHGDIASTETFLTDIEELRELGAEITQKEGGRISRLGWYPFGDIFLFAYLWGGAFYDPQSLRITVDDPIIIDSANYLVELAESDEYDIETMDVYSESFGGGAQNPLIAETVTMYRNSQWIVANAMRYNPELDYFLAPHPWPESGGKTSWAGGHALVIPKGAPNQDLGWDLISYMGSDVNEDRYCRLRGNIPTHSKFQDAAQYNTDPNLRVIMDLFSTAHSRPPLPIGAMLWTEVRKIEDLMIHGKGSPEEMLKELNPKLNSEMQKYL